jgi:hypothetical protein
VQTGFYLDSGKGKRPFCRPRSRWQCNIKRGLECDGRLWTVYIWLRIWASENCIEHSGEIKWEISLLLEEDLASQEGLHHGIGVQNRYDNAKDCVAVRTAKQVCFGACHTAERRRDTPPSIYRLFYNGPHPCRLRTMKAVLWLPNYGTDVLQYNSGLSLIHLY